VTAIAVVVGYVLQEAVRRRVFLVVLLLTAGFLALYALGADRAFEETRGFASEAEEAGVDSATLAGATVFGLSMFATVFLGTVLVVFLTLGAVRGDAERGLLQPLVVRPIGRTALLAGRFVGATAAGAVYVAVVYAAALAITRAAGGWMPDRVILPAIELIGAIAVMAALSLLGSVVLSANANGIATFMVFGAGLTAGLLGQIGEAVGSGTLEQISTIATWVLPFEALYQDGLAALTADTIGLTKVAIDLGPFGGARTIGIEFAPYVLAYLAGVGGLAAFGFARRDL
jgi:ABC-type transport system involved in multi-copper enzyme maturation permease subunit